MLRQDKVAKTLKKEISLIIHDAIKDPRLGFVTIIRVEVTADLRQAKVFFSVLGKEEERIKTKEALDSALGYIRHLLAEKIQLRFAPEIVFKEDRSSEYSVRIQEIIEQIKEQDESKKGHRLHKKK